MKNKELEKLFDAAVTENAMSFKEAFKNVFIEEFNKSCSKLEKEVNKELARFDVVQEGISIPLNNPKIKDAHLFAIESDEDNMVLKFNVDGQELDYNVPEEKQEFYKALEGVDDLDDEDKERIATDLNEFMNDVDKDKKDESLERGEEIKKSEVKMESDMANVDKETRLKLLKKLGEKMQNEKSKSMNEENDEEIEEAYSENIFKITGKKSNGDEYVSRGYATKEKAAEAMKSLDSEKYKNLSIKSSRNAMYSLTQGNKKK